jgi:4-carboxymuconolactone decarboxylase
MRLPLISPAELTPAQKSLYDEMREGIKSNFNAFKVERKDGALMGPWNPWLHEPQIGKAIWDFTLAMTANASLPDNVRQIAILVVGAYFDAAYELYAHIAVAEKEAMKPERLATLVANLKPNASQLTRASRSISLMPSCGAARCPSLFTGWRSRHSVSTEPTS